MMLASAPCGECGAAVAAVAAGPYGHCTKCLFLLGLDPFEEDEKFASDLSPILARRHGSLGVKFHRLGDYELIEEIARGGMGVVFRARQVSLNRRVALKLILDGRLASSGMVRRFQVEAEAAAGLHHPNIVAVFETGECDGHHFYSMELVEGAGLDRVLSNFRVPVASAADAAERNIARSRQRAIAELMATLARTVAYAHQRGVLHRDIKPSNILIDRDSRPHLADFGLAKLMDQEGADRGQFTVTGAVLGTPSYMAPELAAGRAHQATTAADVYSLGAILYELLAGVPPFQGATPIEIWRRASEEEAKNPSAVNRAIDADLSTICLRCLEKEPGGRYDSAGALAEDLEHWLAGEPISARPVGAGEKFWRWCRRKPATAILALTALLAIAGGIAGVWTQWNRAEREARTRQLHLYAADIGLAQQAMREGNMGRGRQLLDAYRPAPANEDLRGFEWRLLRHAAIGDYEAMFVGHSNAIRSLAFSPDGQWLATASGESVVKIWDMKKRGLHRALAGHTGAVNCVAFSPDSQLLATTSEDGDLRLWDTRVWRGWEAIERLACKKPYQVAFSPTAPLLAYSEGGGINDMRGRVRIWNYVSQDHCGLWTNVGNRLAFGPDGKTLFTGGSQYLAARDVKTGKAWTRYPSNFATLSIHVSADGRLAACSFQGEARLFSPTNLHQSVGLRGSAGRFRGIAFSPDGRLLAGVGGEQVVLLWNTTSLETAALPPRALRGHGSGVRCVGFSPDGQHVASGDKDGVVLLWNLNAPSVADVLTNVFVSYTSAPPVFSADSRWMAAPSAPNEVAVFDLATMQCVRKLPDAMIPLGFDAARGTLMTLSPDYVWQRWDVKNGREVGSESFAKSGQAFTARLSPDGHTLAAGYLDGSFRVWDVKSKREMWQGRGHRRTIREIAFSPDATQLGTASEDGTAKIWELAGQREVATLEGHSDFVATIAFSPDGRMAATGSLDHSVRLWSVKTGRQLAVLAGHKEGVFRAAFTPDGRTLATASDDNTVRLWNLATHREVARVDHGNNISTVGFTPDGERMACSSHSQEIYIYRAPSFRQIEVLEAEKVVSK